MNEDVYKSPAAELTETASNNKRGSPLKAIGLAVLIDLTGSLVAGLVLLAVYVVVQILLGMEADTVFMSLNDKLDSAAFETAFIIAGSAVTVYVGYLCARAVNHYEYRYVGIYALIVVLVTSVPEIDEGTTLVDASYDLLTFACAYLGAWIHVRRKHT